MADVADTPAGTPIFDTWGQAVADRLNTILPMFLSADHSSDSTAYHDCGDCSIPVVNGRVYNGTLVGRFGTAATNQGVGIAFNHPGGTLMAYAVYYNAADGSTQSYDRMTAVDTDAGPTTQDSGNTRLWACRFTYECTADGTLQLRCRRRGTSSGVGHTMKRGFGGLIMQVGA